MILHAVAPKDLRPLDLVMLNQGWWVLLSARPVRGASYEWRLRLDHEGDVIAITRTVADRFMVERSDT